MSRSEKKANRLLQIEAMLLAHPEGLTQAEIARKFQVHRSTIGRYIPDLPKHIFIDDIDGNKWKIDREGYLVNVRLSLHEALAVHLAARLLATHMDRQNPHAAAALRKLGLALERLAPRMSTHLLQSADMMDDAAQRHDPLYLQVLEKLTLAWAKERKVKVWHRHEPTGTIHNYAFSPYFIEPYAIGQTTHTIGWREPPGALRTFKIERIEHIDELQEPYPIPANFNPRELLADAWGIWYTEEEPEEVVLRFHQRVANRVRESRWHSSQKVAEQPDGSLLWRAEVAEPQEMIPWIRGWGADCKVLEPKGLREVVMADVQRSARGYKITTQTRSLDDRLLQLWGKTGKRNIDYHPALYHMLDVAHVAQQLLSAKASPRWRNVLAAALNADVSTLHEWLPWLIALHDIGKISVPFQAQNETQRQRLKEEGFEFGYWRLPDSKKLHHTIVGGMVLEDGLNHLPLRLRTSFLAMVSGHHGLYQQIDGAHWEDYEGVEEPAEWRQLRQRAMQILENIILQNAPTPWPEPEHVSAAVAALNGFTILCDWLGSDEKYFKPAAYQSLIDYLPRSRQRAHERVRKAGFFEQVKSGRPTLFAQLFAQIAEPRPLQQAIDAIPASLLAQPSLIIIEAPTGEGKTEAALALAHRIAAAVGTDELYIALPTMATSNAMYGRIQEHLRDRLGLPLELIQLVHGQNFLVQDDLQIAPLSNGDEETHPALAWFQPKKKALLAPFGVGTIDQAELSALNVRHNALRLIGLAGKVVILDEVHAYDAYMLAIIGRMLQWLSALGSSVILLSATLPRATRRLLAEAYNNAVILPETETAATKKDYPSLLVVGCHQPTPYQIFPNAYQPHKTIYLHTRNMAEDAWTDKAQWLLDAVREGGCVCWIANTVHRGQQIFDALQDLLEVKRVEDIDCILLHARFPLGDRQAIEQEVLEKYGKGGEKRPFHGIVVGTQVLEQSLDLDFDVMMSDLAPIDLLLQRAGRLHRHDRDGRPPAHAEPHFYINCKWDTDGYLSLGSDRFYAEYILRQTWETIRERDRLALPDDYRPLVETVYHGDAPVDSPLYDAWQELQAERDRLEDEAGQRLTREPNPDDVFYRGKLTFSDDEEDNAWLAAKTRWGQTSVTVIPLMRDGDQVRLIPTAQTVPLDRGASRQEQFDLLRRTIRLSQPGIVHLLIAQQEQLRAEFGNLFTQSPLLKHCIPLRLEPTGDDSYESPDLPITLDRKLGIVIRQKGKEV